MAAGCDSFARVRGAFSVFLVWGSFFTASAHAATCESLFREAGFRLVDGKTVQFETGKPWFERIDFEAIENLLRTGEILENHLLAASQAESGKRSAGVNSGKARLLSFAGGVKGVWKPESEGEAPAYRLLRRLGVKMIPPTVDRELDGVKGSLQYFVETKIDLLAYSESLRHLIWESVPEEQRNAWKAFAFVFGQWDLNWGNRLVDETGALVMIDNHHIKSRSMTRFGELPFIRRMTQSSVLTLSEGKRDPGPFPFDDAFYLRNPTKEQIMQVVGHWVTQHEFDKYWTGHFLNKPKRDRSMRITRWDGMIWVQAIGFANYGPLVPTRLSAAEIAAYRALTFEDLRADLDVHHFPDRQLRAYLERRDQLLKAMEGGMR